MLMRCSVNPDTSASRLLKYFLTTLEQRNHKVIGPMVSKAHVNPFGPKKFQSQGVETRRHIVTIQDTFKTVPGHGLLLSRRKLRSGYGTGNLTTTPGQRLILSRRKLRSYQENRWSVSRDRTPLQLLLVTGSS